MKRRLDRLAILTLWALGACGHGGGTASQNDRAPMVATCVDLAPGDAMPETGCFNVGEARDLRFEGGEVYWHVRTFPDRPSAQASRSESGVVAEADGRVWLTELGPRDMAIHGGERVAVVGPLEVSPDVTYHAVVSYARMLPGDRSVVHTHPGPEGWYVIAGEQCIETPEGTRRASAGETMTVEGDVPIELSVTGTELRRSILVVVHDAAKPRTTPSDWKPTGACAPADS